MNTDLLEECLLLLSAYMINYNKRKSWPHHSCQKEQPIHLPVANTATRTKGGFTSPSFWAHIIYKSIAIFLPEQRPCKSNNHQKRKKSSLLSFASLYLAHKTCLLKINNACSEQGEIHLPPSALAYSHRERPRDSDSSTELHCTSWNSVSLGSVITVEERYSCQGHAAKWPSCKPRLSTVSSSWLHLSQVCVGKAQLHPPALWGGFTPPVPWLSWCPVWRDTAVNCLYLKNCFCLKKVYVNKYINLHIIYKPNNEI